VTAGRSQREEIVEEDARRYGRRRAGRGPLAALGLTLALATSTAAAEAPSTSLPLCWSPEAARPGTWTKYTITMGAAAGGPETMRVEEQVSLVARAGGASLVESQSRMAQVPGSPLMVMQAALADGDTSGRPRRLLVQVEDGPPLDASAQQNGGPMPVPDFIRSASGRPRRERVRFRGRELETTIREARDQHGMTWRVWCADRVQPLGVVRLELRGTRQGRNIVYDMQAVDTGAGARPRVIGKSAPYTDEAFLGQLSKASRAMTLAPKK
jgi:hypothetical protein